MYAVKILSSFNKSFSKRVVTLVSSLKRIRSFSCKPKHPTSFGRNLVENDVVLFSFEKPSSFLLIYILSTAQFGFWMYTGRIFFQALEDPNFNVDYESLWGKILQKEREHSKILMPLSFFLVTAAFGGAWFHSFRSIRTIMLHKGGKQITFVTYGLPGFNTVSVPLSNISSLQPRMKAKKYIPIKIKNIPFHYLLDVTGKFLEPVLFDYTVGIKRAL